MTAQQKTCALALRLQLGAGLNPSAALDAAHVLRRAQLTLRRWATLECGAGNDTASWSINRDEKTGKPYLATRCRSTGRMQRFGVPDRERGALERVDSLCKRLGLYYYHQTDPRGCTLYVAAEPLTDSNHSTRGVACCV